ncbi:MAG: WxcM-like domain-containing protein [Filimonas sp.]|nr:WxcM-like domain-containing protein [Filimonas sp.]
MENINIIHGEKYEDIRGILSFVNEFNLKANNIQRFYNIKHNDPSIVRAWQAHKKEQKWFYVLSGSFKIVLVKPDNWTNPSSLLPYSDFILNSNEPKMLHVPGGFANGFKALEPGSIITIFSDFTLSESKIDSYRFESNLWYTW